MEKSFVNNSLRRDKITIFDKGNFVNDVFFIVYLKTIYKKHYVSPLRKQFLFVSIFFSKTIDMSRLLEYYCFIDVFQKNDFGGFLLCHSFYQVLEINYLLC